MEKKFIFDGREATVIIPDKPNEAKNWVWRAEFLGAFDYADRALLEKGWHIVYYRVSNMYGCPQSIEYMKAFRDYAVKEFGLNERAAIFGFSRGGLYTINYAAEYPEDIGVIYLDAPVVDITTWPRMTSSAAEWEDCKRHHGITEDNPKPEDIPTNPINRLEALKSTGIPLILVAGDSDEIVPYDSNGRYIEKLYENSDVKFKVILKPGVGHHPHSLENPAEIVDFIEKNI